MAESKRRYRLESGMDTSITLEIDTTKITPELAEEINGFWSSADEVLRESNGDIVEAVARRAAGPLLWFLIDGWNKQGAVDQLSKSEGWPDAEHIGISITDYDIPDLSADQFDVTEVAVPDQGGDHG